MLLVPGFEYVDLGPDGGPYDERAHPKVCWHTTEGSSLAGAEAAFRPYPPHLGYDPRSRDRRQYVDLLRHSYALLGDESDDEYVIQVEVVGRAAETPSWPAEWYRNIGVDVIRPLRQLLGVPDAHPRFYSDREGVVLASARSPIRLTDAAFRTFSGHLGHQHVPAPDAHWDPGGFRIDEAINYSHGGDMTGPVDLNPHQQVLLEPAHLVVLQDTIARATALLSMATSSGSYGDHNPQSNALAAAVQKISTNLDALRVLVEDLVGSGVVLRGSGEITVRAEQP